MFQLQLFPHIFKFWTPLLILALPWIVCIHELFCRALISDYFEVNSSYFRKIAYVWNCCGSRSLEFVLLPFEMRFPLKNLFPMLTTIPKVI